MSDATSPIVLLEAVRRLRIALERPESEDDRVFMPSLNESDRKAISAAIQAALAQPDGLPLGVEEKLKSGVSPFGIYLRDQWRAALNAAREIEAALAGPFVPTFPLSSKREEHGLKPPPPIKPKKGRGHPGLSAIYPVEAADRRRAVEAWRTDRYRTFEECARELGYRADGETLFNAEFVRKAVDANRKNSGGE